MSTQPKRPATGILWMVASGLCFVAVTTLVKLVGDRIPPAQSAFLRYVLGLVFLIPMIRPIFAARLTPGSSGCSACAGWPIPSRWFCGSLPSRASPSPR